MSAEEDADLRDLVAHTLESNGILGKIKAELRAKVFMVLEAHDKNETNQLPVVNEKLRNFMNTKEGRLVTGLVREFMEYFELDYSLAVFDPETNFGDRYQGRASLAEELSIGDVSNSSKPVLSSLLENSAQGMPKLDFATLSEDKLKKTHVSPEISPRSSLSSGSKSNSPRISRIPQRVKDNKKGDKSESKTKTVSAETKSTEETKSALKLGNADLSLSLNDDDDDDILAEFTKPRRQRNESKKGFLLDEDTSRPSNDDQWLQPVSNFGSLKSESLLPGTKAHGVSASDLKVLDAEIDRKKNELGTFDFGRPAEDKSGTDDYNDSYPDDFNPSSHSNDDNSIEEELEGDPISMSSYKSEGSKADDLITSDRVVSPLDFNDLDYKEDVEDF